MDAALPSHLDLAQLRENLGDDDAFLRQMMALFIDSMQTQLLALEAAMKTTNILAWRQVLHRMKGAAQNVTARRLAGLCFEAEAIDALPHQSAAGLVYHLQKELALLRWEIDGFISAV